MKREKKKKKCICKANLGAATGDEKQSLHEKEKRGKLCTRLPKYSRHRASKRVVRDKKEKRKHSIKQRVNKPLKKKGEEDTVKAITYY